MAGLKGLKKRRRIQIVTAAALGLLAAVAVIYFFVPKTAVQLFRSPTETVAAPPPDGEVFRIGGLVREGSITPSRGVQFEFTVTDGKTDIPVRYVGDDPRPDLFKEGQGTVATGRLVNGTFEATEILAKHDESYMPAEVIDALKEQGVYVDPKAADAAPATN